MQFKLIEMGGGWPYGALAKLAMLFIWSALIVLIYHIVSMLIRYSRLWRWTQLLAEPLLTQLIAGKWEPDRLSWPAIKNPQFFTITDALRQELSSQGSIAVVESLKKALELLAGPFNRMIYHMHVLGWSACLMGYLGAMGDARNAFRGMALMNGTSLGPLPSALADAVLIQIYGLLVGLACLAVSSFSRSRLSHLYLDISKRILAASTRKGT